MRTAAAKATRAALAGVFALSMLGIAPAAVAPAEQAQAAPAKVYIAPYSGTKCHIKKSCWTLKKAKSIKKVTLSKAKSMGFKSACKVCSH